MTIVYFDRENNGITFWSFEVEISISRQETGVLAQVIADVD
jgi:hypothetical protein